MFGRTMKAVFYSVTFLSHSFLGAEGFCAGPLVKVSLDPRASFAEQYCPIESIQRGDFVVSCESRNSFILREVTAVHRRYVSEVVRLMTKTETICAALTQEFFSPLDNRFLPASELEVGDTLDEKSGDDDFVHLEIITGKRKIEEAQPVYSLSLQGGSCFLVSEKDLIASSSLRVSEEDSSRVRVASSGSSDSLTFGCLPSRCIPSRLRGILAECYHREKK